jgi:hypothetical protein
MSVTTSGMAGEEMAHAFLKGKVDCIQQLDWLCQNQGRWFFVEVKHKKLYTNNAFTGTGLDKSQLWLRMKVLKELKLQTFMIVFVKGTNDIYGQYLDVLNNGKYIDTTNEIRIYDIKNFIKLR